MKFYWALKLIIYTVYPIVHACMCVSVCTQGTEVFSLWMDPFPVSNRYDLQSCILDIIVTGKMHTFVQLINYHSVWWLIT